MRTGIDHYLNLIDGALVPARSGATLDVVEPATGAVYADVAASDAADVNAAVNAARRALPSWSALPSATRAAHLERLAALIERELNALAAIESRDTGKPIALARTVDIPRAVANLRFFAAAATQFASEAHDMGAATGLNVTLREPIGVAACISPWNLPLYLLTWKIAPALAAGNTVVAKPSELTPASAARLAELTVEAGLPPGVLNIVHGVGAIAGAALVDQPGVAAVSFTGSTAVGKAIATNAGARLRKVSLELGGKNPLLIFADADLDVAVATTLRAAFSNQGQICLCASRLLVERRVYDTVRTRLIAGLEDWQPGDPALPSTRFGALSSSAHLDKVLDLIALARREGGSVLAGGARVRVAGRCADGFFAAPTLIEGLGPDARVNREEIFGPVLTIAPFDDLDHALALANASDYGLAASVFTGSQRTALAAARGLRAGIVWVNAWMVRDLRTPFGGVGQSGIGREGGFEAMRFFTEPKNVFLGA